MPSYERVRGPEQNVDAFEQHLQQDALRVEQLERKTELLSELASLDFNPRMQSTLQRLISTPILQFKGLPKQNTVDRVYDRMQQIKGMIEITRDPKQKDFLWRLYRQTEATAAKHPKWMQYKRERTSNESKLESEFGTYVKAIAGLGLGIKSIIDFKNGNTGLAAAQLGLAVWMNRLDKYIDPMRLLTNEVKFLHEEDSAFRVLQKKGVKGKAWAEIARKIMSKQEVLLSSEEQTKLDSLGKRNEATLRELLKKVKTDAGKQTVIEWIEHSC